MHEEEQDAQAAEREQADVRVGAKFSEERQRVADRDEQDGEGAQEVEVLVHSCHGVAWPVEKQ